MSVPGVTAALQHGSAETGAGEKARGGNGGHAGKGEESVTDR